MSPSGLKKQLPAWACQRGSSIDFVVSNFNVKKELESVDSEGTLVTWAQDRKLVLSSSWAVFSSNVGRLAGLVWQVLDKVWPERVISSIRLQVGVCVAQEFPLLDQRYRLLKQEKNQGKVIKGAGAKSLEKDYFFVSF